MRDILNRKNKVTKTVAVMARFTYKIPAKIGDPGTNIHCSIGKTNIFISLCDLGAGVSDVPYSLFKKLKLGEYSCTSIALQMADKTTKKLVGMIEDVLFRIDQHVIPTDFII